MEERRLRAHLVRIYIVTVAAVLFAVLFAMALLFNRDAAARSRESFSTLLFAVTDQLRNDASVSHAGLRTLEQENRLLLSLRENGRALLFNSADSAEKRAVFARVEALARADGCALSMPPLTSRRYTSSIYAFSEGRVSYLGAVSMLPLNGGYCTITMAQRVSAPGAEKIAPLFAGYIASLLLLSVVGVRLIDRALLPAVESRKRQTRFVAAASHELRSPLSVIAANAATIAARTDAAEQAAAAIEGECARMSRLIGDMLLLASTDAKDWPVKLAAVEADTVLLNVYERYAPLAAARGCALKLFLPEAPLPRVAADAERLGEVLSILLDNALAYGVSEESRVLELAARPRARGVSLTVTDHGKGLTDAQKAQVFERFYRGDASRKEKQHFGLGLSIAQELIRLQNGRLTAEDTPGGGCTFRVTLFSP